MSLGILTTTFSSLRHRNFRYWWFGQCISLMGTWMQRSAQIWLVYTLTNSPVLLGLLGVFQAAPLILLSLPAGVIADRYPKRKIVMITQSIFTFQALAMAALTWTGKAQYWQILVLATLFGVNQAFDNPARQSFYIDLVGKEDLMNAIALNSSIVNLAKIVGPSVAAVIMAWLGPAPCFVLNAISFIAVLYGLSLITVDGNPKKTGKVRNLFLEARQGLNYIWSSDVLRMTAILVTVVSCFAQNTNVIIPVFTVTALNRGVTEYGLLMSVMGFGALLGALWIASRSKESPQGTHLVVLTGIVCGLQITLSMSKSIWLAGGLLIALGSVSMAFTAMSNSRLQLNASDEYRGRVMSFYALIHNGSTPLGNFFAGAVMEKLGGAAGFGVAGALTLVLVGLIFLFLRNSVREGLFKSPMVQ